MTAVLAPTDNDDCFGRSDRKTHFFRALVEHSLDLITVLNADGVIVFDNASVTRVLGYDGDELLGTSVFELVHPDDLARVKKTFDDGVRTPGPTPIVDFRCRHKNGTWRVLESVGSRVTFPDGSTFGIVNSRDITDHRGLQDQIRHAQRLGTLGRFLGSIVHEFQNSLQLILGNLDLLLETRAADQFRDELQDIKAAAEIARSFSRQLLDLSRPNSSPPQPLDVNRSIGIIQKLLQPLVTGSVEIRTNLRAVDATVLAHHATIDQIVMNLASNARDAMPQGGILALSTRNAPWPLAEIGSNRRQALVIEIADSGTGMAPDVQARIFEPFFTTKDPGKGTGLGLSTVWSIVQQAGGTIEVRSVEGTGTTFTIYWPLIASRDRA